MIFASSYKRKPAKRSVLEAIRAFNKNGHSEHGPGGLLLAPLLTYCLQNRISFTLTYLAGGCFSLRRWKARLPSRNHWMTADGRYMRVSDMTDDHVRAVFELIVSQMRRGRVIDQTSFGLMKFRKKPRLEYANDGC